MTTIPKTNISGQALLNDSRFNKGSAFTSTERELFNLTGLLPTRVETIEEQCARCYQEFKRQPTLLDKNIYLTNILNQNEILFYKLAYDHVTEMLPIIYTPVVSEAVEHFNHIFQRPRGLFLSYPERDSMEEVLRRYDHANIDIIIITDGERILGIGDHGVGGISLCIGKLALYTLCAGIHPSRTLPICIDIGTNNKTLLNDPLYLGWRHERLTGQKYDHFIDQCVITIKKYFLMFYYIGKILAEIRRANISIAIKIRCVRLMMICKAPRRLLLALSNPHYKRYTRISHNNVLCFWRRHCSHRHCGFYRKNYGKARAVIGSRASSHLVVRPPRSFDARHG